MELFGIALSVPVALVASTLYCFLLDRVVLKCDRLGRWLRVASLFILALFVVEIVLLMTLGSVRSNGLFGPGFYATHVVIFFLGAPALANLLVLRPSRGAFAKWYVAAAVCTVFAFFLVLLQYSVSESIYGIE